MTTSTADVSHGGLDDAAVAERVAAGAVNIAVEPPGRSVAAIIAANVLTPVNAIMIALFVLVLISGHWRDGLFVGVVLSNSVVGVTQEVTARRELARLQVLTEPKAEVVRNGSRVAIDAEEVVLDDVLALGAGAQIVVDGEVLRATGLELDESMLTGESRPVPKSVGDSVLSGSIVTAGSGLIRATAVGSDSFAAGLTTEAKTFDAAESQLRKAVDRILHWLTVVIPIASILLLLSLLDTEERWQDALQGTIAAAVAMVPDGLVLLTSLAFVAGVLELTRRNALARQLSTVEVLARVDTLCLDKTGTITTGRLAYADLHPLADHDPQHVLAALAAMGTADEAPNATMTAIRAAVGEAPAWELARFEPFSSVRKWSAAEFVDRGWYFIGAPDFLVAGDDRAMTIVAERSSAGKRLLAIARSKAGPTGDRAPADLEAMAIVELVDEIRPDANAILEYFAEQDVRVKIISGDGHDTVEAIARKAGLRPNGPAVDARTLPEDLEALAATLEQSDVFGRVAPRQKQAMVKALQASGHVVAMTGDGVNDVLALKDADLGIAMGSGSPATRSVADLVLTDDSFSTLPIVVREGRKVINNVERVANLFVSKAVYAVFLTLAIGALRSPFPFLPRQLTLIGTFSIGVPGFFLALAPEVQRVRAGFLERVLRFSLPAGLIAGVGTLAAYEAARDRSDLTLTEARSLATITLLGIGLFILVVASRPLRPWKLGLAAAMAGCYTIILAIPWFRDFFEMDMFGGAGWLIAAVAIGLSGSAIALVPRIVLPDDSPEPQG